MLQGNAEAVVHIMSQSNSRQLFPTTARLRPKSSTEEDVFQVNDQLLYSPLVVWTDVLESASRMLEKDVMPDTRDNMLRALEVLVLFDLPFPSNRLFLLRTFLGRLDLSSPQTVVATDRFLE